MSSTVRARHAKLGQAPPAEHLHGRRARVLVPSHPLLNLATTSPR